MENEKVLNVLVLGNSGVGKSTLIKAISGTEVLTGVGEGNTQKIDVYSSSTWPLTFIDTKGFEYNIFEQRKTINQVKKFTKEQISDKEKSHSSGIDVVWYCIDGTSRRTFSHNIKLMNKAIKGWKNVPVFVVITKSYSESDIPENIEAIKNTFNSFKDINLKNIIPVVAVEYAISEEVKVPPMGIEELCSQTLECVDEAKAINEENKYRMVLEQKRFTANSAVLGASFSAVIIGAVNIPVADSVLLVPLEVGLTKGILKIYGIKYSQELVSTIVGSAVITNVARNIAQVVPLVGNVANAVVAGAIVFALGGSVMVASEAIYTGKIDQSKIDEVTELIAKKMNENPIIGAVTSYFEKNKNKLDGKKPKEIFDSILKDMDKNK